MIYVIFTVRALCGAASAAPSGWASVAPSGWASVARGGQEAVRPPRQLSRYSLGMRTRNAKPTMNSSAMESTNKLEFPVICVNTEIRNVLGCRLGTTQRKMPESKIPAPSAAGTQQRA